MPIFADYFFVASASTCLASTRVRLLGASWAETVRSVLNIP